MIRINKDNYVDAIKTMAVSDSNAKRLIFKKSDIPNTAIVHFAFDCGIIVNISDYGSYFSVVSCIGTIEELT